jgi:hypothetical protein
MPVGEIKPVDIAVTRNTVQAMKPQGATFCYLWMLKDSRFLHTETLHNGTRPAVVDGGEGDNLRQS